MGRRLRELMDALRQFKIHKAVISMNPSVEITREEALAREALEVRIELLLRSVFIEPKVLWWDLTKETPKWSYDSLTDVAKLLDVESAALARELTGKRLGVASLIGQIKTACVMASKEIRDEEQRVIEFNSGLYESHEKLEPADWLPKILREFRLKAYPPLRVFIDLLDENSATRKEALKKWYEGRRELDEAEKEAVVPEYELMPA